MKQEDKRGKLRARIYINSLNLKEKSWVGVPVTENALLKK